MLNALVILKLIGVAIMVVWFVKLARSGWPERAEAALRQVLNRCG